MFLCAALNESVNKQGYCGQLQKVFESGISAGGIENNLVRGDLMQTSQHGLMIWMVMQRNVWSDIASWRTQQPSNCTKLQLHALMTINSKRKNWDLLENCQKCALELS